MRNDLVANATAVNVTVPNKIAVAMEVSGAPSLIFDKADTSLEQCKHVKINKMVTFFME